MERGWKTQRLAVSEGDRDLGVTAHEIPVILPRLPSRDSNVDDRALDDVEPFRHAQGDQVRAKFGAGPHGLKRPKNSGGTGNRVFGLFAVSSRIRLLISGHLSNFMMPNGLLYH
jgi:hypothetical protein